MKSKIKVRMEELTCTIIAVVALFSILKSGRNPPFGVYTSGPKAVIIIAYYLAIYKTSSVFAPRNTKKVSSHGNMTTGNITTYSIHQYKYCVTYEFARSSSSLPRAGPISATAPIEKATGSEVQARYSTAE